MQHAMKTRAEVHALQQCFFKPRSKRAYVAAVMHIPLDYYVYVNDRLLQEHA